MFGNNENHTGKTEEFSREGLDFELDDLLDLRNTFTKSKNKLSQIERPNSKDENYVMKLLIYKDKLYRETNGLPKISSDDPSRYASDLIDSVQKSDNAEIKNGIKCPKCGKLSAFRTAEQRRAGDEGQSMVLKCSIKSCGFSKLLSN